MTTARGLLRRLIFHGRLDPTVPAKRRGEPPVEERLEAAKQRLKQTIPPPEDQATPHGDERTIPPPEGMSPGQESPPPVLDNPQ
jgi:hypothetical protein